MSTPAFTRPKNSSRGAALVAIGLLVWPLLTPQVAHDAMTSGRLYPGAEALEVLEREGEIPVCISDIYMPEMDGLTFLREALKRYPDMAVIMLTGVAEVTTAVECLKLGALDYISKPVDRSTSVPMTAPSILAGVGSCGES